MDNNEMKEDDKAKAMELLDKIIEKLLSVKK